MTQLCSCLMGGGIKKVEGKGGEPNQQEKGAIDCEISGRDHL